MALTLADLLNRLTRHMGGEDSYDAQGRDERVADLNEAYFYISEKWQLNTKDFAPTFGQPNELISADVLPGDFQSYTGVTGKYNALPTPLTNDADLPWAGRYATATLAISYYAAFRIFEDKGPEMYEKALYWKQRYDLMAERLDMEEKRRNRSGLLSSNAAVPFSFGALRQWVSFNLDQSDMTPEERRSKFPQNIIDAALNRSYLDISNKFELNINSITGSVDSAGVVIQLPADFVAPATSYATLGGFPAMKVAGDTLPDIPPSVTDANLVGWFPYAPSYRLITAGATRWVQFSGLASAGYPAAYTLYYDGKPTPMTDPAQLPWGGVYDDAFKLICYKTMRDLMYGDNKTYNMSRFWQNEYDREEREFRRILRRLDGGARVAVFGYSRTDNEGNRDAFYPINAPDATNGE